MNNRPTTLRLPGHLPYPITITSLLVRPDSPIKKHDGLLVYKFYTTSSEEDRDDQDEREPERNKEMVDQFDSPWEGILTEWLIKEGDTVHSSRFILLLFSFFYSEVAMWLTCNSEPILSVIEPCLHEISFKDICAICGTDLSVYSSSHYCGG